VNQRPRGKYEVTRLQKNTKITTNQDIRNEREIEFGSSCRTEVLTAAVAEVLTETATVPVAVETGAAITTGAAAAVTVEIGGTAGMAAAETPSSELLVMSPAFRTFEKCPFHVTLLYKCWFGSVTRVSFSHFPPQSTERLQVFKEKMGLVETPKI
jgi:hypothetical protein